MKNTIAKIAVLAAVILTIGVWAYAHSYKLPPAPQFAETQAIPEDEITNAGKFINVDEYEAVRANLYDAALNLCIEASSGSYVWENFVSAENKHIITTYRVPSLEVLLNAIREMDCDGSLCDSFDEPLEAYDKAYYEYNKLVNRAQ
jgi:hypothetical protein